MSLVVDGCTVCELGGLSFHGGGTVIATRRNDASRQVERTSRIISATLRRDALFQDTQAQVLGNVAANLLRKTRENVRGHATTKLLESEFWQSVAIRNKRDKRANKSLDPFFHFPGERCGRKIANWKKHAQLGHVAARDSVQFTRKNRGRRHGEERQRIVSNAHGGAWRGR